MTFVARGEDLLSAHPRGLPTCSLQQKAVNSRVALSLLPVVSRNQVGNRLPMSRDGYGLATLDVAKNLREVRFGLCGLHFPHRTAPSV